MKKRTAGAVRCNVRDRTVPRRLTSRSPPVVNVPDRAAVSPRAQADRCMRFVISCHSNEACLFGSCPCIAKRERYAQDIPQNAAPSSIRRGCFCDRYWLSFSAIFGVLGGVRSESDDARLGTMADTRSPRTQNDSVGAAAANRSARAVESSHELRTLIDTVPALAWTARPDGSTELFNRRWLHNTSYPRSRQWTGGREQLSASHSRGFLEAVP